MELIKFLLNNKLQIDDSNKLYFRLSQFAKVSNDGILLPKNETVSLDTYFNVISSKYFHYVDLINPQIKIDYIGNLEVKLFSKTMTEEICILKKQFSSTKKESVFLTIDKSKILKNSILYLSITSLQDNSAFYAGSFTCDNTQREIKLGVTICTYKREEFVKNNLVEIKNYLKENPTLKDKLTIYVVDNGQTLSKDSLPQFVRLIPNENSGGSGGFTRGLREIIKNGTFTHFLFMDDDIAFEPSVLEKTINLLSVLKEKYKNNCIGGTMLIKDRPTIQHEFGGYWQKSKVIPNGKDIDLASRYGLIFGEQFFNTDYNAWWYTCMPTNIVNEKGYPLEMLFVQLDDVEYGIRSKKEFIHINGIGVWHESFDYKYSPAYQYFIKRNNLIVVSRFSHRGFFKAWLKYLFSICQALFQQRYFMIDISTMSFNDFLKGADYVKTIKGAEQLKKLAPYCPKLLSKEEIEKEYNINLDDELEKTNLKKKKRTIEILTLNSYLLPSCCYRKIAVVDMVYPRPVDFYKAKTVIHYNSYTKQAFVTTIKKGQLFKGLHYINKMFFKLLFKYHRAKKSFKSFDTFK